MKRFVLFALCSALALPAAAARTEVIQPNPAGILPVACSNFSLATGTPATALDGDGGAFVAEALAEPAKALVWNTTPPVDSQLFAYHGGTPVSLAAVLCFPTTAGNTDPDYTLPNGQVLPHMVTGTPVFDTNRLYPLVVFSHGVGGSPVDEGHLKVMLRLAAYGYAVLGVFHGDGRFAADSTASLFDLAYLYANWPKVVELQAMRPLGISGALDALAARPEYAGHVDLSRVAALGISLGGEGVLLAKGGKLLVNLAGVTKQVTVEPRIAAAAGIVPFTGLTSVPFFGPGQKGMAGVPGPYMAVSGGADQVAPAAATLMAVQEMGGSRYQVVLDELAHSWNGAAEDDILTWLTNFYGAYFDRNLMVRGILMQTASVAGGMTDHVTFAVDDPLIFGSLTGQGTGAALSTDIGVSDADADQPELSVYLAANLGADWFFNNGVGWRPWQGGPFPAYLRDKVGDSVSMTLNLGLDCAFLANIDIYAGYGRDDADMIAGGKYAHIARGCL